MPGPPEPEPPEWLNPPRDDHVEALYREIRKNEHNPERRALYERKLDEYLFGV